MKIGGALLILTLFGGAAAGTLRAGFPLGAMALSGLGLLCLFLLQAGSAKR